MKIVAGTGNEDIAMVYVADMGHGRQVEFVESVQPPLPRNRKWVLIISTLYGCPVGCRFCDAGNHFDGKLDSEEMFSQIDFLVGKRFPADNGNPPHIPVEKFKIQFARMGEPAFNNAVLEVLKQLPERIDAPGLMPSLSTIAPAGSDGFFEELLGIKEKHYRGRFQLQFSIHTTDEKMRDWLIPVKKWDLDRISEYGERFHREGDRKITLNFALADGMPVAPDMLLQYFDPSRFLVKITPVNPTYRAVESGLTSHITPGRERYAVIDSLQEAGYEVILSIGELEENHIGSNCGQHVMNYLKEMDDLREKNGMTPELAGYSYELEALDS